MTLKGPKGNIVPLTVGPEVRNLAQVKVGDKVVVTLRRGAVADAQEGRQGAALVEGHERSRARARRRAPGRRRRRARQGHRRRDRRQRQDAPVTLKGPQQTVDLYVEDPAQLKLVKVGDQIEAEYTQAVALTVEPVAPAKK